MFFYDACIDSWYTIVRAFYLYEKLWTKKDGVENPKESFADPIKERSLRYFSEEENHFTFILHEFKLQSQSYSLCNTIDKLKTILSFWFRKFYSWPKFEFLKHPVVSN